jgi:hypothetical protein
MNIVKADLLNALKELSDKYPHWRAGQLVANLAGWADREIWDVEDDELLAAARRHLEHAADVATEARS